jgi:hypothetical protein
MSKLTEDETVRLLRETFADREHLIDGLPTATTSSARHRMPILLAAAAVLAVLGGTLYVTGSTSQDEPGVAQSPTAPVTSAPTTRPSASVQSTEIAIWAAAAEAGALIESPAGHWPVIFLLDAPHTSAGSATRPLGRGVPFSPAVRSGIADRLKPLGPVQWVPKRPTLPRGCAENSPGPVITLGPVVHKGGHAEVGVSVWRGCLDGHWMTYRIDRQQTGWRVTGTVGPVGIA